MAGAVHPRLNPILPFQKNVESPTGLLFPTAALSPGGERESHGLQSASAPLDALFNVTSAADQTSTAIGVVAADFDQDAAGGGRADHLMRIMTGGALDPVLVIQESRSEEHTSELQS